MMKEDIWGRQTLLTYTSENEVFGETFAVQKNPDSYVTFIAGTDTSILFVAAWNVIHCCPSQCTFHEQLTRNMFDILGQRSIRLMERIEISSKPSLREKILAYLSMQAQRDFLQAFSARKDTGIPVDAGAKAGQPLHHAPAGTHRTGQLHRCQPQCPDPRARLHARRRTHRLR